MFNLRKLALFTMLGFAISANAQETQAELAAAQHDTLVVVVKHEKGGDFFERTGRPFKKGYKAVENAVVEGYQTVENAFVDGYKTVENNIVNKVTDTVSKSIYYQNGYRGNVELFTLIPNTWGITTSHGYSFGNGLYLGGGAGFAAEFIPSYKSAPTYLTPLFVDLKYSFIDRLATPFVNVSTGAYADITNIGIRYFINPSLGVDIGRVSLKVGYEYQLGVWRYNRGTSKHNAKIGISFTF